MGFKKNLTKKLDPHSFDYGFQTRLRGSPQAAPESQVE
jgi:hypothetical protein